MRKTPARDRIQNAVAELRRQKIHPTTTTIQRFLGRDTWRFLSGAENKWFQEFVPFKSPKRAHQERASLINGMPKLYAQLANWEEGGPYWNLAKNDPEGYFGEHLAESVAYWTERIASTKRKLKEPVAYCENECCRE